MAVLYQVGLALSSSMEIDAVLDVLYEKCCQLLAVDAFYVAWHESPSRELEYHIFVGEGQRLAPFRLPVTTGAASWVVGQRQPLRCDDVLADAPALSAEMRHAEQTEYHAYLGAPLLRDGQVIGTLAVLSRQVGVYGQADAQLLVAVAGQAALALGNARVFQDVQQKLAETAILAEVSHAISANLTQEELLPYLARNLTRVLSVTDCCIVLRDPYTGELRAGTPFVSCAADAPSFQADERDLYGYRPFARAVVKAGRPMMQEEWAGSRFVDKGDVLGCVDRSLLGLPLIAQGRAVGAALIGYARGERYLTDREIRRAMVIANQIAVAIANARLFREVEQRLVELGTLAEISRVISSSLQPSELYQRVVDELARAFGYPFVAVYRVEGQGLELGAQFGYGTGRLPVYVPNGHGLAGGAAATGQISYVPDTSVVPDAKVAAEGIVSQIAVPLRKDERLLGVLVVESYESLIEADLSLLQSMSYQVGTAVENARLYAAERRGREVARTLLQISGDLSGTLHLNEVLELIMERLRTVVPYESAAIGLLSGGVCYLAAAHDMPRARHLWGKSLSPDELPLVARVLREREAVIVADKHQVDEWVSSDGDEGIRSWLGVPLVVKDRIIGLLMLNHVIPAFYDAEAAELALAFAQHAALAIENARLYEQAQAKLHEQTLLYEMTTAISSTLDAGQVLRLLAERLVTVLGGTSVRIATLQGDLWQDARPGQGTLGDRRQAATLVAQHHSPDADWSEREDKLGTVYTLSDFPVTTEALTNRQPLLAVAQEAPEEWRALIMQRGGGSLLLLPLVARDRVTGFVELWDSRSRRRFTEVEMALAQTLINQAAVAVDNARLFAETQRRLNELTLLYDMVVTAASSRDLNTLLQSIVKTLQFRVLEGAVVSVFLLDESQQELQLRAQAGQLQGLNLGENLSVGQDIYSRVMQDGQPLLIHDTAEDPRGASYGPAARSILCVPLAWGQRNIGVLSAFSAQRDAFSAHDRRLLRTMASSLAITIENVRLLNALKRSEKALTLRNCALERANVRLQELDRIKSVFVASVNHELRTPLNAIIGFSEVLIDGLAGDLPALAQEYLNYVHGSGKHLLNLINDILDLSKIQAGRMTLTLDQVDVLEVLSDVQATMALLVRKKDQTLQVKAADALPSIVADRSRLKQILLNLVGNANKFTQEGGQITARVCLPDPETLQIDVIDDGPGIALEDQVLIFEEFRQAGAARAPGEGTGLGLAITRRLVELHGGRVWVESEPGAGAIFTVLLPVTGPESEKAGPDETDAGAHDFARGSTRDAV